MSTTRSPRRMARDPQPQSAESAPMGDAATGSAATGRVSPPDPKPARVTKQSMLIRLLEQDGGASLADIVEATGWQPHTTRAALTGLRKKGHAIERFRSDEETRYRIVTSLVTGSADGAASSGAAA
jgi:hypothetical protein